MHPIALFTLTPRQIMILALAALAVAAGVVTYVILEAHGAAPHGGLAVHLHTAKRLILASATGNARYHS